MTLPSHTCECGRPPFDGSHLCNVCIDLRALEERAYAAQRERDKSLLGEDLERYLRDLPRGYA